MTVGRNLALDTIRLCPFWETPLSALSKDKEFAKLKPEHALLYVLLLVHMGDDIRALATIGSNMYETTDPLDLWATIAPHFPLLKEGMAAAIEAWVKAGLVTIIDDTTIQLERYRPYASQQEMVLVIGSQGNAGVRRRMAERGAI